MKRFNTPAARVAAYTLAIGLCLATIAVVPALAGGPTCAGTGAAGSSTAGKCLPDFAPPAAGPQTFPVAGSTGANTADKGLDWGFAIVTGGVPDKGTVTFQFSRSGGQTNLQNFALPDPKANPSGSIYIVQPAAAGQPLPPCGNPPSSPTITVSKVVVDAVHELLTLTISGAIPAGPVEYCFQTVSGGTSIASFVGFPDAVDSHYNVTYTEPGGSVTSETFATVAQQAPPAGGAGYTTSVMHICQTQTAPCGAGTDLTNAGIGTAAPATVNASTTDYVQITGIACQTYAVTATNKSNIVLTGTSGVGSCPPQPACAAGAGTFCTDQAGNSVGTLTVKSGATPLPFFAITAVSGVASDIPSQVAISTGASGGGSTPSPTASGGGTPPPSPTPCPSPTGGATPSPCPSPTTTGTPPPPPPGNSKGAYVLDGYGGLHTEASSGNSPDNSVTSDYFGFDIARGLCMADKNSGYIVDGYGGVHSFAMAGQQRPDPALHDYWGANFAPHPNWDIAKGCALLPGSNNRGYVLDAYGGVHPFGPAGNLAPDVDLSVYYQDGNYGVGPGSQGHPGGWDIMRGIVVTNASPVGGYVLDGYGGLHPFVQHGLGQCCMPSPPQLSDYFGFDIAKAVVATSSGSAGFVLDGYGGVHGWGSPMPTNPQTTDYWGPNTGDGGPSGNVIARGLFLVNDTTGYVLDGYGGMHPFAVSGSAQPTGINPGGSYWPGWDIARGAGNAG
ncbi:MAG: hypothetical protein ACYDAY_01180 [Candidatus Dormibacteria bacterium]